MAKAGALDRLAEWRTALEAERQYRGGSLNPAAAYDARERLIRKLDEMGERARAAPGWRSPTTPERQQSLACLEASFREHGYPQLASACAELRKKAI